MPKPLIAVVSPFIDKRHGTERSVAECIERLSGDYDIHVYGNRVEDLNLQHDHFSPNSGVAGPSFARIFVVVYCESSLALAGRPISRIESRSRFFTRD